MCCSVYSLYSRVRLVFRALPLRHAETADVLSQALKFLQTGHRDSLLPYDERFQGYANDKVQQYPSVRNRLSASRFQVSHTWQNAVAGLSLVVLPSVSPASRGSVLRYAHGRLPSYISSMHRQTIGGKERAVRTAIRMRTISIEAFMGFVLSQCFE